MNPRTTAHWSVEHSAALYGIRRWGAGFFDMDANGDVTVKVKFPSGEVAVSLMEIARGIGQRDHAMPVLLRIENLLDARISFLNETFRAAIAEADYQGEYRGVFPVKVNQQCHVIEESTHFGALSIVSSLRITSNSSAPRERMLGSLRSGRITTSNSSPFDLCMVMTWTLCLLATSEIS